MINLFERLKSKDFRDEFSAEHIRTGIAYQIRALREGRGWSQKILGDHAGKAQNLISRFESPNYGKMSIQTLNELAAAFDVALMVRFVSFGELLKHTADLSPEALAVPHFEKDPFLKKAESYRAEALSPERDIGQPQQASALDAPPPSGQGGTSLRNVSRPSAANPL